MTPSEPVDVPALIAEIEYLQAQYEALPPSTQSAQREILAQLRVFSQSAARR